MNEKSKRVMNKQQQDIYDKLTNTFNLTVYEDEISESEMPEEFNDFLIVYGDFQKTSSPYVLLQEIYVVYVSENRTDIEEKTLDVITVISEVNGIEFDNSVKERLQKKDMDSFIDQVTLVFTRKIKYGY